MSRRAEVLGAAVWALAGGAIALASWRMDRLDTLAINPWSAPGLTPGVIGVLIVGFALALAWQALHPGADADADAADDAGAGADAPGPAGAAAPAGSARRTFVAALFCVLFAGLSLGHGLPFVIEGSVFVFAFTAAFSWSAWRAQQRIARGLVQTFAVALVACGLIAWLFESVFLVRLP